MSCRNAAVLEAIIAVRRRLIKAVFLFSEESSESLMGNISIFRQHALNIEKVAMHSTRGTFLAIPSTDIQLAQLA